MTQMLDIETLVTLAEAGIQFSSTVRHACGGQTIEFRPEELSEFIEDPDLVAARHYKVSKADYLEWLDCEGYPRCGAITKQNKQCGASISGGGQLGAYEWSKTKISLCAIHGGESAKEARSRRFGR